MINFVILRFYDQSIRLRITFISSFFITLVSGYLYFTVSEEVMNETISGVFVLSLFKIFSLIMVFMLANLIKKDTL